MGEKSTFDRGRYFRICFKKGSVILIKKRYILLYGLRENHDNIALIMMAKVYRSIALYNKYAKNPGSCISSAPHRFLLLHDNCGIWLHKCLLHQLKPCLCHPANVVSDLPDFHTSRKLPDS
jgi:hypothetical protein